MFSSLASYLFGTNKEETIPDNNLQKQKTEEEEATTLHATTINVTSLSPSVSGDTIKANTKQKSTKNKRRNNSKQQPVDSAAKSEQNDKENNFEDSFIEDDWFIVENEDEMKSLVSADSVTDLTIGRCSTPELDEVNIKEPTAVVALIEGKQKRRQHLIEVNALYNGPRHQQQRNYLQRRRNGTMRGNSNKQNGANTKAASVERDVPLVVPELEDEEKSDNSIMTQSLYFSDNYGVNCSMDESWFVTPPPCFTSIGPSNMESSPFENLLIEHPSMSVYHSIRSAQRGDENIDTEAEKIESVYENGALQVEQRASMPTAPRVDRFATIELKKQMFANNAQKSKQNVERQKMSRGATKRANKISEGNSKNHRPRRSELQHSKVFSNANNNRKICY